MPREYLRFQVFNSLNWNVKKVNEILDRIVNPVAVEDDTLYKQIGIRSHGKGIFHKELVSGKEIGKKRVFWIEKDLFIVNIVFAWESAIAITSIEEVGLVASHRFPMYRPKEGIADLNYLLHFFLTKRGNHLLQLASPGGAGRNKTLGQKEFEKLSFKLPSLLEQQKIADYLSTIDQKISLLDEKKAQLSLYKKGVMQKLFSLQVRFKDDDGVDFENWKSLEIGKVLSIQSGKDYKHLIEGNIPVYGTGGIMKYVNNHLHDGTSVGIGRKGTIDKPVLLKGKFWTVDTLFYTTNFNNATPEFIYYVFLSINWIEYNEASGVPSLSKSTINKIKIPIPSLLEQQKIADFLSAIDDSINKVEEQIQQTKLFKKAMLQQMFV